MLRNRKLILLHLLIMMGALNLVSADESFSEGERNYLTSVLKNIPKEGWEYSFRGGYLFRFEADVVGDSMPEFFLASTLKNEVWAIFDGEARLLGEISSSGLEYLTVRRLERSSSILDVYELSASEKFITQYEVTPDGVQNKTRQVKTEDDEKEYNLLANLGNGDDQTKLVKIKVYFTHLENILNKKDPNWELIKKEDWVLADGYYVHRDDIAVVRKIKASSSEDEIRFLMGGFTQDKALEKLGVAIRSNQKNNVPNVSQLAKYKVNQINPNPSSEKKNKNLNLKNDRGPLPLIIGCFVLLGVILFLFKVWRSK